MDVENIGLDERHGFAIRTGELAYKFLMDGKLAKAERLMKLAICFAPERPVIFNTLGAFLMSQERFNEAVPYLSQGIDQCLLANRPEEKCLLAHLYNNRSVCLYMGKALQPALVDIFRAIEILPNDPNLWNHRSNLFFQLNDFSRALESAEIALTLDVKHSYSYYLCAVAHYYLCHFKESLRMAEIGLHLSGNSSVSRLLLEIKERTEKVLEQYGNILPADQWERVIH